MFELLITGSIGILFICIGLMIWKKQKIALIHFYHYTKVKEKDKKAYTTLVGKGLIIIGTGCIFTGVFDYTLKSTGGWIGFGVAFFYGLSIILKAQKKYNGGLF